MNDSEADLANARNISLFLHLRQVGFVAMLVLGRGSMSGAIKFPSR